LTVDFLSILIHQPIYDICVINNVNDMESHRVRTFSIPRFCSSFAWWWPTAAETCCLYFNIFI